METAKLFKEHEIKKRESSVMRRSMQAVTLGMSFSFLRNLLTTCATFILILLFFSPSQAETFYSKYKLSKPLIERTENFKLLDDKDQSFKSKFKGWWKFKTGSGSAQGDDQMATSAFALGNFKSLYNFNSDISFFMHLGAGFQSTYLQETFQRSIGNFLSLKEAVVVYRPIKQACFGIGAINQGIVPSSLFISGSRAFPGLMECADINWGKKIRANLSAQQVVPTSSSFSSERIEKEVQPSLQTETLTLQYALHKNITVEGYGALFKYSDLPSVVAESSRLMGNTGLGSGAQSEFAYDFQGWASGIVVTTFGGTENGPYLRAGMLKNEKAVFDRSKAQHVNLGMGFRLKDYVIQPEFRYSFIESDAVPAKYLSWQMLGTNYEIKTAALKWKFKKNGFNLNFLYKQADPLIKTNIQDSSYELYEIQLETDYASF
ncbi:MAG: hypothetical protein HOO06_10490 [Bdellovibrionaceae bacterium]|nr:hypothetical protein [Pseudobdellovibrionaceae bacterium]